MSLNGLFVVNAFFCQCGTNQLNEVIHMVTEDM